MLQAQETEHDTDVLPADSRWGEGAGNKEVNKKI